MTDKILYWVTMAFAGLALLLFITNTALINGNQKIQATINERQFTINNAMNLSTLNQNLTQALAEISIKNDDKQIRDLLSSQGITIRKNAAADKAADKKPAAAAAKQGE